MLSTIYKKGEKKSHNGILWWEQVRHRPVCSFGRVHVCGSGCAGLLDDGDLCAAARIAGKVKVLLLVLLVAVFCRQDKSMQPVSSSLWLRLLVLKEIPEYPVCAT